MISRKFLNAYQNEVDQASKEASVYVKSAYQVFMEQNPNASFIEIRNYVLEAINDSLSIFGGQASLIANDFFDQLAEMAGEDMTSEMYENVNTERVNESLHYYAKNLVEGHNEKFEKSIVDLTAFHVKREAFENLKYNCKKKGLAYARVPSGREACAFCFILASRGFCYDSEFSAGGKGNDYHPHCDCIIVPGFGVGSGVDPDKQIEGYKPTQMQDRYNEVCKTVDGLCTLEKYRESGAYEKYGYNFSEWKNSIVSAEIRQRDKKWLWSGNIPLVKFETKKLKEDIKSERQHELRTVERLRFFGMQTNFKVDQINNYDGYGNNKGLADLANGYELKSLSEATSKNTLNKYLKGISKRKKDAVAVVFDNTENVSTDEKIISLLKECRAFSRGRIYIITKDKRYLRIR